MIYLIGGTIEGVNVLFVSEDNNLQGSENKDIARTCFPSYKANHGRSYEASMSACVHWMSFKPKMFRFEDLKEVRKYLDGDKVKQYKNVSGSVKAIPLKKDYEPVIEEEGKLM